MMLEKKYKKKFITSIILLLFLSVGGQVIQQIAGEREQNSVLNLDSITRSITQEYTLHDPITVNNDDELAAVANNGTGVKNDPYIIANLNITGSPTHGISIEGTTKHFRIENCWIASSELCGIFVRNITPGSAIFTNNTCTSNFCGGITLSACNSSLVANNSFNDYNVGIRLHSSSFSTIVNNTFFNNGLDFLAFKEELLSYTIENNKVNELPLGYLKNKRDSLITGTYGQLILVNCNNTIVKNQNCSNTFTGIALYYCKENYLVNNTCNNNRESGITLISSNSATVISNTCNENYHSGIDLQGSSSSTLAKNTCNYGYNGISLWDSDSSTLINNTCNFHSFGIFLRHSSSSILTNNTCTSNFFGGIHLENSCYSTLTNNTCNGNWRIGIRLDNSSYSILTNNTCNSNNWYGLYVSSSHSLFLAYNILKNNGISSIYLSDSYNITSITTNPTTNEAKTSSYSTSETETTNSSSHAFTLGFLIVVLGLFSLIKKHNK